MVVMNQSSAASPAIKSISLTTNIGFRSPPIIPSADGEQDTILDYDTDNGGKHLPQGAISRSQRRLMIAILAGFTGYYFCRTNLVVSMSSLLKSLPGVDKGELGTVLSFGYLFYAIGKLVNGALIDIYGGRKMFLVGLMGTVGCTLLITLAPSFISVGNGTITTTTAERTLFALGCVWSMNRFFQSAGWGSLVKVLSHAFPSSMHGRVLGMATVSVPSTDY
jgi:sugar phosphate permease